MRAFKARRTRVLAAAALGIVIVAGSVGLVAADGSGDEATADAGAGSTVTATTAIKRQDLVEIETEDGTLGYADSRSVVNRLPGTVTWLPPVGHVVRADRILYKVDDSPVILMNGRVPAYRALGPGVLAGADVRQLERALRAAGHDPDREIEIDRSWDSATTAAVKRWQQAHGFSRTAQIALGRIVFLPGARRISSKDDTLGASADGGSTASAAGDRRGGSAAGAGPPSGGRANALLTTTSTRRLVTVDLDSTKSALAKQGARVTVELPSGQKVRGRISSVGKVATSTSSPDDTSSGSSSATATIEVTIRLLSVKTGLDRAPVSVRFEQSRRTDVLAIPVTALLARPGGRFAVQLVQAGGKRRVVAAKPGLYTSGFVEIAGAGLRPGQRVTNAAVR